MIHFWNVTVVGNVYGNSPAFSITIFFYKLFALRFFTSLTKVRLMLKSIIFFKLSISLEISKKLLWNWKLFFVIIFMVVLEITGFSQRLI